MMLDDEGLGLLFRNARTFSGWLDRPVSDDLLHQLYDLMKWGPTSANSNPARFVFIRTKGAYLIMAARALGLDCGPLSGFDNARVDEEFFAAGNPCEDCDQEFLPAGHVKSNFLCNVGYGNRATLHPRLPRLAFDEACTLL